MIFSSQAASFSKVTGPHLKALGFEGGQVACCGGVLGEQAVIPSHRAEAHREGALHVPCAESVGVHAFLTSSQDLGLA